MKQEKCKSYASFLSDAQELYGSDLIIHGPYKRNSDGRRFVLLYYSGLRTTKLYAKVKLEIKLGRVLTKDETVDHADDNPLNDKFSNLELLSRASNSAKSAVRRIPDKVSCAMCCKNFIPTKNQVNARGQNKSGPFCSRSCSGRYGKYVQLTGSTVAREKITVCYK